MMLRFLLMPLGITMRRPRDELTARCANLLLNPSATRERLTEGVFTGNSHQGLGLVEEAFRRVCATDTLREKLKRRGVHSIHDGLARGVIDQQEAQQLYEAEDAVTRAVEVDQFAAEELGMERAVLHPREINAVERKRAVSAAH